MNDWDEIESLRKQVASYKTLLASLESQVVYYRAEQAKYLAAISGLESERAANAKLTEELAVAEKKAARYDYLRDVDFSDTPTRDIRGKPWVVYLDPKQQIPTSIACRGVVLDTVCDAAMQAGAK